MPDFAYSGEGVRVASVSDDSPAAQAGLQKGDIIIRLGKQIVHNLREYSEALKSYKPGDEVTIVYRRDNQEKTGTLKLVAR